jgi:hypothetical protein
MQNVIGRFDDIEMHELDGRDWNAKLRVDRH